MSYSHFSLSERISLAEKLREGKSLRMIASEMGRSPSTISRELKRNRNKDKSYNSWRGMSLYLQRRKRCRRKRRLDNDPDMVDLIIECLEKGWPPEAIVGRLKQVDPSTKLGYSTIYRAISKGLLPTKGDAKQYLARKGKKKYGHREKYATIKPDHTIHDRPSEVELRQRFGDWEGDTIVSGGSRKGCVFTCVDRTSRLLVAARSPSRDSEDVEAAMLRALASIPVKTLTLDNGPEFAKHRAVSESLNAPIYFADPHSPWQRGTNENMNGKIRFFFPKKTEFSLVTDEEIDFVVDLLNDRPRKCLGWLSPREVFRSICCT